MRILRLLREDGDLRLKLLQSLGSTRRTIPQNHTVVVQPTALLWKQRGWRIEWDSNSTAFFGFSNLLSFQ